MPRSTLPAFDPLEELGIRAANPKPFEPRKHSREPRPPATPKGAPLPSGKDSPVPDVEPEQPQQAAVFGGSASTPAEVSVLQPRLALEPRSRLERSARLESTSADTAVPGPLKAKTGGRIALEVLEEVRDCVVWHGHAMTIDSFTEAAFREHLKRLRREHDLGERFPVRGHPPKQGRRVS